MAARKSSAKAPAKAAAPRKRAAKKKTSARRRKLNGADLVGALTEWRNYTLRTETERQKKPLSREAAAVLERIAGLVIPSEADGAISALADLVRPGVGTVVEAVERDLRSIAERPGGTELAESALAAAAVALARELDDDNSATSKSMCVRALNETLSQIRELAPEEVTGDEVDQLAERRKNRQAAAAKASG